MRSGWSCLRDLDVALNEARLLGVEVNKNAPRTAAVTLEVLALPGTEDKDVDHVVRLVLVPVGRVAASLRHGRWDDRRRWWSS